MRPQRIHCDVGCWTATSARHCAAYSSSGWPNFTSPRAGSTTARTARRPTTSGTECVHRIAQGAKPADLPVERPNDVRMAVNLKTARAMGIAIPKSIIVRADEVIE